MSGRYCKFANDPGPPPDTEKLAGLSIQDESFAADEFTLRRPTGIIAR